MKKLFSFRCGKRMKVFRCDEKTIINPYNILEIVKTESGFQLSRGNGSRGILYCEKLELIELEKFIDEMKALR